MIVRIGPQQHYLNRRNYVQSPCSRGDYDQCAGKLLYSLREGINVCLAIPMKITAIDGFNCTCEARGIERDVSLFMLQGEELAPGDHVLVHVGYAIQRVSESEARASWQLFDEMLAAGV